MAALCSSSSTALSVAQLPNISQPLFSRPCCPTAAASLKSESFLGFSTTSRHDIQDAVASSSTSRSSFLGHWRGPRRCSQDVGRSTRWECRANSRAQEDVSKVKEIVKLSESLLSLKDVVTTEYRAVGPEMRDRVGRLYDRAVVLQQSADRALSSGSRLPSQLTSSLIALQREHGSLENIVRLTMEASPALASLEDALGKPSSLSDAASNLILEEAKPKASIFQNLVRESVVKPVKSGAKYVMSAPESQGSSPLAAFRAEIERRVIEQLAGKKMDNGAKSSSPTTQSAVLEASPQPAALELERQTEEESSVGAVPSAGEDPGTVESIEKNLKQLELELAKSIPIQVFEQKMLRINMSLSEAKTKVAELTTEVMEKEAMVTTVKEEMLAEQEQLKSKVRELTGDLEKKFSEEDIEAAVTSGLHKLEQELEEEQERARLLTVELEKKEMFMNEQQEKWRIQKVAIETQLKEEHDQVLGLSLEVEKKDKEVMEQQEAWNVQKTTLQADLKTVVDKFQEVRKKRTKERAQLAEKKLKVKALQQELDRVQESMAEEDRIRLKKKEAVYATVRMLISQMVLSARARTESEHHASGLAQEMAKLQEEKQALEVTKRAAEVEADGMKSTLAQAGKEVANLKGEMLSEEKAAALEKFFAIMAKLIKEESDNIDESIQTDDLSEDDLNGNGVLGT